MFGIVKSLFKCIVGVLVQTPAALVADLVTFSGALTEKDRSYTEDVLENVMRNFENVVNSK